MSAPIEIEFETEEEGALAAAAGTVVVLALGPEGLTPAALAADAAMGGGLTRAIAAAEWKGKPGDLIRFPAPAGLSADALLLVSLGAEPGVEDARKAGGAVSAAVTGKAAKKGVSVFAGGTGAPETAAALAFGMALRAYGFDVYKTGEDDRVERGEVRLYADAPEKVSRAARDDMAVAEGVFFARDLVNEPANVLGTEEFAARLAAMGELGLEIEILEEADLRSLGMRALLGVGEGSVQPTKVVVMHWRGGGDEAPVALVGKGVVFDTGGISLKPAGGMEEMTMDMGGAGLVAGVMRALALRGAKANVVGLVGLVENMPDGKAQRPGDIVKGEKAGRLPMDPAFDKQIKSRLADIKNTGGRPAGSITAAQFLKRFVKDEVPWIHVDIAGVALVSEATDLAPRGATGWGVRAVDALVKGRETR